MLRGLILAVGILACLSAANAAQMDGVSMPDHQTIYGTELRLNGIGLRTYSIFGIHIYVAALYLEQRTDNSSSIISSRGLKLLVIRFLHDVTAEEARKAWQEGFEQNCQLPCYLDPHDVQRFLADVPPVHRSDVTALLFTPKGVEITHAGRLVGRIDDPHFAEIILSTFIGPVPPTPRLKRELLGLNE
jgi:hypothetical protein